MNMATGDLACWCRSGTPCWRAGDRRHAPRCSPAQPDQRPSRAHAARSRQRRPTLRHRLAEIRRCGRALFHAALGLAGAVCCRFLRARRPTRCAEAGAARPLARLKCKLALFRSTFWGFAVQSLVALWLLERFDMSLAAPPGVFFFWSGVLSAHRFPPPRGLRRASASQHHGVHPVRQHLPDRRRLRAEPVRRAGALLVAPALSRMDRPPTRTSLRDGGGDAGRRRCRASVTRCRAARLVDQPGLRRRAVWPPFSPPFILCALARVATTSRCSSRSATSSGPRACEEPGCRSEALTLALPPTPN